MYISNEVKALEMGKAESSKFLVSIYNSTRLYNPGDQHCYFRHRENLRTHIG
jgi:hypothetical protein